MRFGKLWVDRLIPRDLSAEETIAAIHEQGGLALAPHPFAWLPVLAEFTGAYSLWQYFADRFRWSRFCRQHHRTLHDV